MDYEEISNKHHDQYIGEIIGIIKSNPENKKINFFIETIMQSNKEEYILLCNALYKFITPQGGGMTTKKLDNEYLNLKGGGPYTCQELNKYKSLLDKSPSNSNKCDIINAEKGKKTMKKHLLEVYPDKVENCKDDASVISAEVLRCKEEQAQSKSEEAEAEKATAEETAKATAEAQATEAQSEATEAQAEAEEAEATTEEAEATPTQAEEQDIPNSVIVNQFHNDRTTPEYLINKIIEQVSEVSPSTIIKTVATTTKSKPEESLVIVKEQPTTTTNSKPSETTIGTNTETKTKPSETTIGTNTETKTKPSEITIGTNTKPEESSAQAKATESSLVATTNNTKPEESSAQAKVSETTAEPKTTTTNSKAQTTTENRLIEKLNQIKSKKIKIPHKNKLLIDEQFELKETSKDIKYKYYLSFYIIDAINNIVVYSGGT